MRYIPWCLLAIAGLMTIQDLTFAQDVVQLGRGNRGRMVKRESADITLTDADRGKTIQVAAGKTISLTLEANATTGFEWRVNKIDGPSIVQDGEPSYVEKKHKPGIVGVGGWSVFRFKAIGAGKTTVKLVYLRPWETDEPPAKTFEITFVVAAK